MSHTRYQAAKSSPRWRPPDLEFRASLDENFIGLESSLEAEISVINLSLYNPFAGGKKKSCHFGMNFLSYMMGTVQLNYDEHSEFDFEVANLHVYW